MVPQNEGIIDDLNRLIAEGAISREVLHALTGIEPARLATVLDSASARRGGLMSSDSQILSPDESQRLSILASQFVYGLDVGDDERLRGIITSLITVGKMTLENVANLTSVDVDDIRAILDDPRSVPGETTLRVALRGSYLVNAANQARPR